jgi:WXG100 family type VII secretion target
MAGYTAGSAELRSAAQEMMDKNQNLMDQLKQLAAAVDAVQWRGAAATAFQTLMTAFSNDANKLNEALMRIAEEIAASATEYDRQEEAAQQSLSGITQALGGI